VQVGLVLFAPLCALVVILISYGRRPMFANGFGLGEMGVIPSWHVAPEFVSTYAILTDHRLNVAVIVNYGNNYTRSIGPDIDGDGNTLIALPTGRFGRITKDPNRLYLFERDGLEVIYVLKPGDVFQIDKWNRANIESELNALRASRPVRQ
jgi:hypothetical protein